MSNQAVESFEIERKYEVAAGATLPGREALARAGFTADDPETHELHAAYYDTADRDLARNRLAVRVRHGGKDAGWHLKKKGAEGSLELFWPLADEMPAGLLSEIEARAGVTGGLAPIAELRTTRVVVPLRDEAGTEVIELVDDHVRALDHATGLWRAWREWEAEVTEGGQPADLDTLEPLLLAAGAYVSPSPAKIARATGSLVPLAIAKGASAEQVALLRAMDEADLAAATSGPSDAQDIG